MLISVNLNAKFLNIGFNYVVLIKQKIYAMKTILSCVIITLLVLGMYSFRSADIKEDFNKVTIESADGIQYELGDTIPKVKKEAVKEEKKCKEVKKEAKPEPKVEEEVEEEEVEEEIEE